MTAARNKTPDALKIAELERLRVGYERYALARTLNPRQWAELHQRNLLGEKFDDMIDALRSERKGEHC